MTDGRKTDRTSSSRFKQQTGLLVLVVAIALLLLASGVALVATIVLTGDNRRPSPRPSASASPSASAPLSTKEPRDATAIPSTHATAATPAAPTSSVAAHPAVNVQFTLDSDAATLTLTVIGDAVAGSITVHIGDQICHHAEPDTTGSFSVDVPLCLGRVLNAGDQITVDATTSTGRRYQSVMPARKLLETIGRVLAGTIDHLGL